VFISDFSIRRPIITVVFMLALVVFGVFALVQLRTDEFPDVSPPIVSVAIPYPGAAPDTVEREVVDPIEEQISAISGVKKIQSNALDSFGVITVEFVFAKDLQEATQDIRDGISQIRNDLPVEMEEPILTKFDPNDFPIVQLTLASQTLSGAELTRIADPGLTRQLRGVTGVAEVRVVGGIEREMTIELNPQALQAAGVGVGEVVQALQTQNLAAPVGRLNGSLDERTIRLLGRLDTPNDFERIVIAQRDGRLIRLGDVADASDGTEEPRTAALFNGRDAVGIDIIKADGYSATEVSARVGARVDEIRKAAGRRRAHHRSRRRPARGQFGGRRAVGPDRGRGTDGAGGVSVPQLVAVHRHHRSRAAGVGDGLVCRRLGVRVHARHDVAAWPVAGDRNPD
jgi:HAE1 family hydrophobic/amphiphilic exporter-1